MIIHKGHCYCGVHMSVQVGFVAYFSPNDEKKMSEYNYLETQRDFLFNGNFSVKPKHTQHLANSVSLMLCIEENTSLISTNPTYRR